MMMWHKNRTDKQENLNGLYAIPHSMLFILYVMSVGNNARIWQYLAVDSLINTYYIVTHYHQLVWQKLLYQLFDEHTCSRAYYFCP